MKLSKILVLMFAVFVMSCGKEGGADKAANATADSMKTAAKAMYAAFSSGDMAALDKYITSDYKEHSLSPGQKPGLDGLKEWMTMMKAGYSDLKFTTEDIRCDGDMCISRVRFSATNTGPMMGMPPTNKKVDVMFIDMMRWNNGKFVEHWGYGEEMKMMTQLGLMPPMGEAPPAETGAPAAAAEKK